MINSNKDLIDEDGEINQEIVDIILKKISDCKDLWDKYVELTRECHEKGIKFLTYNCADIYSRHDDELSELRIELCEAREE